ncbi:MAG: DNA gyrase modulator [Woeseiaceae bacterium]|nr:DNA gyrase modulator [Woeseiaceae bacterium]
MTVRRRDFLGHLAAGSAVVSIPAFLQGCGSLAVNDPAGKPPANPFLEWFGIDDAMASRVLSALAKDGADSAELYFQYRQSSDLVMEEGVITHSATDVIQGVGLRVVMGGQIGFAFTDDLTLPGMLAAASRAAIMAGGSERIAPQVFAQALPVPCTAQKYPGQTCSWIANCPCCSGQSVRRGQRIRPSRA